jgi:thioredoxin-related protein
MIINAMKILFKILTVTIILTVSCKNPEPTNFYEKLIQDAAKPQKLILLDFTAEWCGGCKAYDKYVFQDSALTKKLNRNFILVKIDRDNPENFFLVDKYRITGLPHIVLIDNKERILGSIEGFDSKYVNNSSLFLSNVLSIVNSQEGIRILESKFISDTTDIETITRLLDLYKTVNQYFGIQRLNKLLVKLNPTPERLYEFNFSQAIQKLRNEYNPEPILSFIKENTDMNYLHKWEAYSNLLYFYRDKEDLKNQDKYYLKLIKLDPVYFNKDYAEFLFENGLKIDTAIILTDEFNSLKNNWADHWGQFLNAHKLANSGKKDLAVQTYNKWMEDNKHLWESGDDIWALYFYAEFANFYNLDLNKALNYIKIAEKNRNMLDDKLLMSEILFKLGKTKESIEKLNESLKFTNNQNEYKKITGLIEKYSPK